jgi:hypothetical protein
MSNDGLHLGGFGAASEITKEVVAPERTDVSGEVFEEAYAAAMNFMAAAGGKVSVVDYSDLFAERRA